MSEETQRHILTDVDEVLIDWAAGFERWFIAKFGPPSLPTRRVTPNDVDVWIQDQYGWSLACAIWAIELFQRSPRFEQLSPFPDAVAFVPRIATEFGYRFVAISSAGEAPETLEMRERALRRHFGDVFSDVTLLRGGASKQETLAKYPATFWLDDHPDHIESGRRCGHHAIHVERRGAQYSDETHRISSWEEFYHFLVEHHAAETTKHGVILDSNR